MHTVVGLINNVVSVVGSLRQCSYARTNQLFLERCGNRLERSITRVRRPMQNSSALLEGATRR